MEKLKVVPESLGRLPSEFPGPGMGLKWDCLFVSPAWMKAWVKAFGSEEDLFLHSVTDDGVVIGIAPLLRKGGTVAFIGSSDVCDYQDFIITPGKEDVFFQVLIDFLKQSGIDHMDLKALRPDSMVLKHLVGLVSKQGALVDVEEDEPSLEIDLPSSWDDYLSMMPAKQRHEIRRKFRRLHESAEVGFRTILEPDEVPEHMDIFLKLFRESREDKNDFMTERMESFFITLARSLAESGWLRLSFLDLNQQPAAGVLTMVFQDTLYLYNSGYDLNYRHLSAGLLCKVLSLKGGIEQGLKKYDFLKGKESYKYRLGAREVPLFGCHIRW